eukprot:scaffold42332_cov63-Phaeocystis_antarctica.AAC.3
MEPPRQRLLRRGRRPRVCHHRAFRAFRRPGPHLGVDTRVLALFEVGAPQRWDQDRVVIVEQRRVLSWVATTIV